MLLVHFLSLVSITLANDESGMEDSYNPCKEDDPEINGVAWIPNSSGKFMVFYQHWYFNYSLEEGKVIGPIARLRDYERDLITPAKDITLSDSHFYGESTDHTIVDMKQVKVRYEDQRYAIERTRTMEGVEKADKIRKVLDYDADCASYLASLQSSNKTHYMRRYQIYYKEVSGKLQESTLVEEEKLEKGRLPNINNGDYLNRIFRELPTDTFKKCKALDINSKGDYILVVDDDIYIRYKNKLTVWDRFAILDCEEKSNLSTALRAFAIFLASQLTLILIYYYPLHADFQAYQATRRTGLN